MNRLALLAVAALPFGLLALAVVFVVRRVLSKRRERDMTVSAGWRERGGGGL